MTHDPRSNEPEAAAQQQRMASQVAASPFPIPRSVGGRQTLARARHELREIWTQLSVLGFRYPGTLFRTPLGLEIGSIRSQVAEVVSLLEEIE